MLRVPVAVELTAVVIGALSGALHAANRKVDVVGTFSLAMSTGVGGGILRDLLIGVSPPVALSHALYLPVVAVAALLAMLFARWLARLQSALAPVDALLLGLWAVIGTEQALAHHLPVTSAVFVGTVTAVGGGALRDLLTNETPSVFLPGELYATAAFAGALAYPLVVRAAGLPTWAGELATVGTACVVRLSAIHWHLRAPTPVDLPARWSDARRRLERLSKREP
jgi:uncharacterized membrane protein YeiH